MDDFRERLLADVLAEEADPGQREALLGETLRLARRKRRFRQMRRAVPALAAFVALLLMGAWLLRLRPVAPNRPVESYVLVRTHPLPGAALAITKPWVPEQ